ncbi:hypothetical protein [Seonamhaeicola sp.]|uniref:hypothetical protein n=1 Tax=Seonamhaeicola sp. TaxID=1912245 RepID=UPI00261D127C|nr:hypothetical protein [Seonamhaeicola sp.]
MKLRFLLSLLFIITQVGLISYARFTPVRFFCWAPYDIHNSFEATATINNTFYDSKQLEERYNYKMKGWEQRSIYNVFLLIERYESTYGRHDDVDVKVVYSINGHPEDVWQYQHVGKKTE